MQIIDVNLNFNQHQKYKVKDGVVHVNLVFNKHEQLNINFIYDQPLDYVEYVYFYDDYKVHDEGFLEGNSIILDRDFTKNGKLVLFSNPDIKLKGMVFLIE